MRTGSKKPAGAFIAHDLDHTTQAPGPATRLFDSNGSGLAVNDLDGDGDEAVVKLGTLTDRIKTASYGYAGLFDPVRIKEEQLDALYRFDTALAQQVGTINAAIAALAQAIDERGNVAAAAAALTKTVAAMSRLFDRRQEAIVAPDLLAQPDYAPPPDLPAGAVDIANDPNAVG